MASNVQYANWWSKLLFKKAYEQQFVIPLPAPKAVNWFLKTIETKVVRADLTGIKIKEPIFIVGLPRSGTSILYNTLCAHPEAAFITTSINSFPDAILGIEWLRKAMNLNIRGERFLLDSLDADFGSPSEPAMFWGKWMGRTIEDLNWEEHPIPTRSDEQRAVIFNDIKKVQYSFGDRGTEATAKRFICKYPVFQTELVTLQELFPDAHFIHIIRDGRMVANSLVKLHKLVNEQIKKIKHPLMNALIPYPRVKKLKEYLEQWGADDVRTTAHVWKDSIELVNSVRPGLKNFHEIKYEDFMKDPRAKLSELLKSLNLRKPTVEDADYLMQVSEWGNLRHQNQYQQFDVIEGIAGDLLKHYGY